MFISNDFFNQLIFQKKIRNQPVEIKMLSNTIEIIKQQTQDFYLKLAMIEKNCESYNYFNINVMKF